MSRLRPILFAAAALAAVLDAAAAPSSLLSKSPFAPPAGPAAPVEQKAGRFELRGLVSIGGEPRFSLFDTSNSKNYWLRLNEKEENVRVVGYDRTKESVSVEVDGHVQEAVLKEVQITTMAAPVPAPVPMPVAGVMPQPGQPPPGVNQGQSEQEIQERRQRIVEELRRRRALRTGGNQTSP